MSKNKLMQYKSFYGSAEISLEDGVLFGKIECINDLVTYEADNPAELKAAFEEAVDDYIQTCAEIGKEPEKPFSGTFNVRVGPDIHKKAYLKSLNEGLSLNDLVKKSIESYLDDKKEVHMHLHTEASGAIRTFSVEKHLDPSKQRQWRQNIQSAGH